MPDFQGYLSNLNLIKYEENIENCLFLLISPEKYLYNKIIRAESAEYIVSYGELPIYVARNAP